LEKELEYNFKMPHSSRWNYKLFFCSMSFN